MRSRLGRGSVLVAYVLFVIVGVAASVNAVLLVAQMADYAVGRAVIGITFFTFAAGFVLAGATSGQLIHRWGTRTAVLAGGLVFVAGMLGIAARPPFVVFVVIQVVAGYGIGLIESVLNAYLAALPRATTLLNRLHAFFGLGAFLGPIAAERMLRVAQWPVVPLAIVLAIVPVLVAAWLTYPGHAADPLAAAPPAAGSSTVDRGGLLWNTLRSPGVLFGAAMLSIYVGLEIGVGTWGYAYLMETREASSALASATVSAYWLGLTLGRFVISPVAERLGRTKVQMAYGCLVGVVAATALAWLVPTVVATVAGFVLLGFFLGPVFPTTMAVAPDLTEPRYAPTAIGVMNAGSTVGGAALPWLAGAIGQGVGVWTLLPFTLLLGGLQLLVWWRMVAHLRPAAQPAVAETAV